MPTPLLSSSFGEVVVPAGALSASIGSTPPHFALSAYATNANAAVRYLQLYNKVTTPAGADRPLYSFPVPAGSATAPGEIIIDRTFFLDYPVKFSTGLIWAVSTTNTTYTAATASDHNVMLHYY